MTLPREPLFLARRNYRLRRIADAARLLPVLGGILFMIPLLASGRGGNGTGDWLVYIFASWIVLIVFAALLSHGLWQRAEDVSDNNEGNGPTNEELR